MNLVKSIIFINSNKTIKFIIGLLLLSFMSYGQVGINTANPNATLDIRASNQTTPANNDGVLIPKVDDFPATNPTISQNGMLVFVTGNGIPNKGFYYWDNATTNWVLITGTGGGSSNTLDQAYDQGGVGLGKNINATDGAVRINGEDGFLVTGSLFSGNNIDSEITGQGTRMFFNPNKGAFRAGAIFEFFPIPADYWDDANVGVLSTAFGMNTTASGGLSTAFGTTTIASGDGSTAFGSFTTASGDYSTTFGEFSTATGNNSIASGHNSVASGENASAFGTVAQASGDDSVAFGYDVHATGFNSAAIGHTVSALSFGEVNIGIYGESYLANSLDSYNSSDKIFVVSNGVDFMNRSSAFTIYKSGLTIIDDTLGINTISPTATLTVNGTANKPGGGAWAVLSDARLKENVSNYNEGLDLITKVKPVNFSYNNKMKAIFGKNKSIDTIVYQGVIAQELQKIAPDMVREISLESGQFLEVDPNKFTYALINAVQQQQITITEQKDEIDEQKQIVEKYTNKIKHLEMQLKKEIAAIKALLNKLK